MRPSLEDAGGMRPSLEDAGGMRPSLEDAGGMRPSLEDAVRLRETRVWGRHGTPPSGWEHTSATRRRPVRHAAAARPDPSRMPIGASDSDKRCSAEAPAGRERTARPRVRLGDTDGDGPRDDGSWAWPTTARGTHPCPRIGYADCHQTQAAAEAFLPGGGGTGPPSLSVTPCGPSVAPSASAMMPRRPGGGGGGAPGPRPGRAGRSL